MSESEEYHGNTVVEVNIKMYDRRTGEELSPTAGLKMFFDEESEMEAGIARLYKTRVHEAVEVTHDNIVDTMAAAMGEVEVEYGDNPFTVVLVDKE